MQPEEPSSAARICVTGEYVSPFPSTSRTELTSLRPARELHTTDRLAGSALEIGRARRAQHSLRRDENGVKEQRRYVRYSSTAVLCCYLYAIPTGSHKQDSHQVLRYPARPLFPRNRQGRALATRPYMTLDGRPALASHPPASPAISRSARLTTLRLTIAVVAASGPARVSSRRTVPYHVRVLRHAGTSDNDRRAVSSS